MMKTIHDIMDIVKDELYEIEDKYSVIFNGYYTNGRSNLITLFFATSYAKEIKFDLRLGMLYDDFDIKKITQHIKTEITICLNSYANMIKFNIRIKEY